MAQESKTTTDHDVIRRWVEDRGGFPAVFRGARGDPENGELRIDFPGSKSRANLERIPWEEFFRLFDERQLGFRYQELTPGGNKSRSFRFAPRPAEMAPRPEAVARPGVSVEPGARREVMAWQSPERLSLGSQAQGLYYLITGLWPLLSIGSFQRVTGPRRDLWLVKTVGLLVGVIGGVLTLAGRQRRVTPEIALLAGGSAAGLAGIDIAYVAQGRISPIYLLDAAAELALAGWWLMASNSAGALQDGANGFGSSSRKVVR